MLLHVEELQMQRDIRNYDMKGVVFKPEREDRRFLILEASLCILLVALIITEFFFSFTPVFMLKIRTLVTRHLPPFFHHQ